RGIIGRQMLGLIGGMGAVTTIVLLVLMVWALDGAPSVTPYAMTMVFTGFVFLEIEGLYVIRWLRETPLWSNSWLGAAVAGSILLQLAVLYTPLNRFFRTVPLDLFDWGILAAVLAVSLPAYFAIAAVSKRIHQ
ncbi:MAG: cation transporting ATPase C-terminal domain-containing protein, partial [Natronomonas sp.]